MDSRRSRKHAGLAIYPVYRHGSGFLLKRTDAPHTGHKPIQILVEFTIVDPAKPLYRPTAQRRNCPGANKPRSIWSQKSAATRSHLRKFHAAAASSRFTWSPTKPLRKQRARRYWSFRWPISGSMAVRRRKRARIFARKYLLWLVLPGTNTSVP